MEDLPPGFRFFPTEEELLSFYLHNKLEGKREDLNRVIPVVDIYEFNPWDLPHCFFPGNSKTFRVVSVLAGDLCREDPEQWFFFIARRESEARGGRPRRLTVSGYWKATGSPSHVFSSDSRIIGLKRTMVFYNGRAPNGSKTDWKMNEYKAAHHASSSSSSATNPPKLRHEFSLCRVYKKSKCLRAFDRRPQLHQIEIGRRNSQQLEPEPNQSLQVPPMAVASSPESSSSGDLNHGLLAGESSDPVAMVADDEPFWDWDQLDWL